MYDTHHQHNPKRASPSRRSTQRTLTLIPSPTLVENGFPTLREQLQLTVLNTLQPVPDAATDACEDGVRPERFLSEDRTHFDTELPKANGDAWRVMYN